MLLPDETWIFPGSDNNNGHATGAIEIATIAFP